ncbi:MAG: response regulator [Acidobacteriota bacterium]
MKESPILIIGEEPHVVKKVEAAVANLGYPLRTAKSFQQAYQFLANQKPLMIISENVIAGRSWVDFFKSLTGIPALFDVPTICLLTEKELIGLVNAKEFKADDYLIKPFRLRKARARIQALLMLGKRLPLTPPLGC